MPAPGKGPPSKGAAGKLGGLRAALASIQVDGAMIRFPDDMLGALVLGRVGGRFVHQGTVSLRGPCGPGAEALAELSLGEPARRALEFVATWFGAPFDAVNVRTRGGRPLSWGPWHFFGPTLSQCLLTWRLRDAATFQQLLGRYGIDIEPASLSDDALGATLVVVEPRSGKALRAELAEQALAAEPRQLAALARAGRCRAAQVAQMETVVRLSVSPALAVPVRAAREQLALGEVLTSCRGIAALLFIEFRFGRRGAELLARLVSEEPEPSEEAALDRLVDYLQGSRHAEEAEQVQRILSSPELT